MAKEGSAGLAVKFGRFIGSIPKEMILLAEQLAMPLISLPNELPFIDVSHPIMLILLNEQADRLAYSDRVYQSLTKIALESSRLDTLAKGLRDILGYEVSMHAEYSHTDKLPVFPQKQVFSVKVKDALYGYIVVETDQTLNELEKIAVSKEVGDIAKLGDCYGQLKQIGTLEKRFKGSNRDIFMEDMDIYLLLSKIDLSMPDFCQDVLGKLESGSEKQREELLETLQTYLECQGNIMKTSTKLFIHRNTLHYRLKKIAQTLGFDLSCPETRVMLWLALKSRLLNHRPPKESTN